MCRGHGRVADRPTAALIFMKLGTIIKLPDGRIGTVCYHHLDGYGGVWGEHKFEMPVGGFGDNTPPPTFMLRDKSVQKYYPKEVECVGDDYEAI
jgi:hypothetical protein